jgi:hypothetical protein
MVHIVYVCDNYRKKKKNFVIKKKLNSADLEFIFFNRLKFLRIISLFNDGLYTQFLVFTS